MLLAHIPCRRGCARAPSLLLNPGADTPTPKALVAIPLAALLSSWCKKRQLTSQPLSHHLHAFLSPHIPSISTSCWLDFRKPHGSKSLTLVARCEPQSLSLAYPLTALISTLGPRISAKASSKGISPAGNPSVTPVSPSQCLDFTVAKAPQVLAACHPLPPPPLHHSIRPLAAAALRPSLALFLPRIIHTQVSHIYYVSPTTLNIDEAGA